MGEVDSHVPSVRSNGPRSMSHDEGSQKARAGNHGELSLSPNFDPYLVGYGAEQARLSLGLESPGWGWHFLHRKEGAVGVDQKQAPGCLSASHPSSAGGWGGRARNPFMLVTSLGA